uniref:Uncharacterized protein n=1 Tax=Molossus molossus TaxID=27622 RepID=A0A7J8HCB3_MOLMO|nr:hypothetical protein HJG59_011107 [Molossus molossus]
MRLSLIKYLRMQSKSYLSQEHVLNKPRPHPSSQFLNLFTTLFWSDFSIYKYSVNNIALGLFLYLFLACFPSIKYEFLGSKKHSINVWRPPHRHTAVARVCSVLTPHGAWSTGWMLCTATWGRSPLKGDGITQSPLTVAPLMIHSAFRLGANRS